jgi:hypothetical protein
VEIWVALRPAPTLAEVEELERLSKPRGVRLAPARISMPGLNLIVAKAPAAVPIRALAWMRRRTGAAIVNQTESSANPTESIGRRTASIGEMTD